MPFFLLICFSFSGIQKEKRKEKFNFLLHLFIPYNPHYVNQINKLIRF